MNNLSLLYLVIVEDPTWEIYIILLDTINIVMVNEKHVNLLEVQTLNFHYPCLLLKIGLWNNISLWFEAKHKQFKGGGAFSSRKNILYTISAKNQLNICHH